MEASGAPAVRAVLIAAGCEAARRGDRRLGTDHLLLGLLAEAPSIAGPVLGVDLAGARRALDALDAQALATVGIRMATWSEAEACRSAGRLPVLSSGARAVLARALARRPRGRGVDPARILGSLLECRLPDPAAQLLAALQVDPSEARRHLESGLADAPA